MVTKEGRGGTKGACTVQRGFTYLGLLILVAVIGIASAATLQVGAVLQRRTAEEELLSIGTELRSALISYANATPAGQPRSPRSIQDLLRDPRYPNVRRHLRRLYTDPLTGREEWGIIESKEGGGIAGFYSLSEARPIKIGNFEPVYQHFADAISYRDWQFTVGATPPRSKVSGLSSTFNEDDGRHTAKDLRGSGF